MIKKIIKQRIETKKELCLELMDAYSELYTLNQLNIPNTPLIHYHILNAISSSVYEFNKMKYYNLLNSKKLRLVPVFGLRSKLEDVCNEKNKASEILTTS